MVAQKAFFSLTQIRAFWVDETKYLLSKPAFFSSLTKKFPRLQIPRFEIQSWQDCLHKCLLLKFHKSGGSNTTLYAFCWTVMAAAAATAAATAVATVAATAAATASEESPYQCIQLTLGRRYRQKQKSSSGRFLQLFVFLFFAVEL